MKKFAAFLFSFFFFCCLQASDFVYQVQFRQADEQEKDLDELEKDQIKIMETIFRDNFNPAGFTQINPFMLKNIQALLSESDDSDFVKSRLVMNKLNITHSILGLVNNMGNVYYVRVFFSEVSPTFRGIAVANFDCPISDSLARCTREFAEKFAQNPNIVEEGKRAKSTVQQGSERDKTRLLYGFLKVFPSDVGKYKETPTEIIRKINASGVFKEDDCKEWRVPTEDEVALLAGERLVIKAEDYMTVEKEKGKLRLVSDCRSSEKNDIVEQNNPGKPEEIYGFLKVFPKDIGEYKKRPVDIVNKINSSSESGIFGCKTWRIPTEDEVALLASRGFIVKADDYLSSDGNKAGLLRLVADMPGYETKEEQTETDQKLNNKDLKKSHPSDEPTKTAEQKEGDESELKLEQDSRSQHEEAAEKSSFWGCSADIL